MKISQLSLQAAFWLFCFLIPSSAYAFIISSEPDCTSYSGKDSKTIYEYNFNERSYDPDYEVGISSLHYGADLKIQTVTNPAEANLLLVDGLEKSDMRVCKSKGASNYSETLEIKVGKSLYSPDIKIQLSPNVYDPDYRLFVRSEQFSDEEAAALFAVIWQRQKDDVVEEDKTESGSADSQIASIARRYLEIKSERIEHNRAINTHKQNIIAFERNTELLWAKGKRNPIEIQAISKRVRENNNQILAAKNEIETLKLNLSYLEIEQEMIETAFSK